MPIPITVPALLSKLWGTSVNNALSALSAGAQSEAEVTSIAQSVADAKFAAVSVDLTDATMTATAETPSSDFAQHLNGTIGAATPSVDKIAANRLFVLGVPYRVLNHVGTSRSSHRTGESAAGDLRLGYGNWTQSVSGGNFGDIDNTNVQPIVIRAAVEYPEHVMTPVFFSGQRSGALENGALLVADAVGVDIPADTQFWVRTYMAPATGDYMPEYRNTSDGTEGEGFTGGSDLTSPGSAIIPRSDSYVAAPFAIWGRVAKGSRAVAILGDSVVYGIGDTKSLSLATTTGGYAARALSAAGLAWISLAVPGERGSQFLGGPIGHTRRMPLIQGCSAAIVMYGVNDLQVPFSPSLASLSSTLVGIWRLLAMRGITPWACTLTPNTSSTDGFATVGNQTIDTYRDNTVRIAVNGWLRDGAPLSASTGDPVASGTVGAVRLGETGHPLAGYFDIADVAESARDSGKWKAALTSDGLHPNATGHAAMAAIIDTDVFA